MNQGDVPRATIGRLPAYLTYLKSLPPTALYTSATVIARELGLGEVQVRKDLSAVSGFGKPKVGYNTAELISRLEDYLGYYDKSAAILVGAGKLGRALFDYSGFAEYGLVIPAAFDIACHEATQTDTGKFICPMETLDEYCVAHKVQIGIITIPSQTAQEVCDKLVKNNIRAIWSFAPCRLSVPDDVVVQYENMALSLAHLSKQMKRKEETP